jgi:hypothetical protein
LTHALCLVSLFYELIFVFTEVRTAKPKTRHKQVSLYDTRKFISTKLNRNVRKPDVEWKGSEHAGLVKKNYNIVQGEA